jgi:ATP-dependent DNA helicase RecG
LKAFSEIDDGFELARVDLQLRGPGNLLSTRQTGFPPLRIADLVQDESVLVETHQVSRSVIEQDPCLAHGRYEKLRQLVLSRYGKVLDLGDVG